MSKGDRADPSAGRGLAIQRRFPGALMDQGYRDGSCRTKLYQIDRPVRRPVDGSAPSACSDPGTDQTFSSTTH